MTRLPELLHLVKPGPRYTSYPPATEFHSGFGEEAARCALAALPRGPEHAALVRIDLAQRRLGATEAGAVLIRNVAMVFDATGRAGRSFSPTL